MCRYSRMHRINSCLKFYFGQSAFFKPFAYFILLEPTVENHLWEVTQNNFCPFCKFRFWGCQNMRKWEVFLRSDGLQFLTTKRNCHRNYFIFSLDIYYKGNFFFIIKKDLVVKSNLEIYILIDLIFFSFFFFFYN